MCEVAPWLDVLGLGRTLQQQWEGDISVVQPPRLRACLTMEPCTPRHLYAAAMQARPPPSALRPPALSQRTR